MSNSYDFPIRKDYKINVSIDVTVNSGLKKIDKCVEFKQATIIETLQELSDIDKIGFDKWVLEFLKKNGSITDQEIMLLSMDGEKLQDLIKTFLVSRYKGVITMESFDKSDVDIVQKGGVPFRALLVLLSKKLMIDPLSFQEKYTFEQMTYLMGGIEYWINEKSDEGRLENKKKYEYDPDYDNMLLEKLKMV